MLRNLPALLLLGTGLSPLAQWIIIPLAAFWWARKPVSSFSQLKEKLS